MTTPNLTDQQRRTLNDRGTLLVLTVMEPQPVPGSRILGHSATGYVWSTMEYANPCEPECVFEVECPYYPGQMLRIKGTDDTAEVVEARAPMRVQSVTWFDSMHAGWPHRRCKESWNTAHPDSAHKWEANPWVWVTVVRLKGGERGSE